MVLMAAALANLSWAEAAKLLPGRSDNMCKNRFHTALKEKCWDKQLMLTTAASACADDLFPDNMDDMDNPALIRDDDAAALPEDAADARELFADFLDQCEDHDVDDQSAVSDSAAAIEVLEGAHVLDDEL